MNRPKIGIQAIVFGDDFATHAGYYFRFARAQGFAAIEVGPMLFEGCDSSQLAEILDETKLDMYAVHAETSTLTNDDKLRTLCGRAAKHKCQYVIVSGLLGGTTQSDYVETGQSLRRMSQITRNHGLRLCYHHYEFEWAHAWREKHAIDYLVDNAGESLGFVIDTYWAAAADVSSSSLWDTYKDMCDIVHLKDGAPERGVFTALGDGKLNVAEELAFFFTRPIRYLTYEQDFAGEKTIEESVTSSATWIHGRIPHDER